MCWHLYSWTVMSSQERPVSRAFNLLTVNTILETCSSINIAKKIANLLIYLIQQTTVD